MALQKKRPENWQELPGLSLRYRFLTNIDFQPQIKQFYSVAIKVNFHEEGEYMSRIRPIKPYAASSGENML